jgi:hypothetical protein
MKERITTRKTKSGYCDFYYKGKNITALWMDFFSSIPMNKEKKCEELFIKKYKNVIR